MKKITATLFIIGIFYSLFAWGLIISPIGIFIEEYEYQTRDVVLSLTSSITSILGYYIWIGWGIFAFKGHYPYLSSQTFWKLSIVNHCSWIFVLAYWFKINPLTFLTSREFNLYSFWIIANIIIAILVLALSKETKNHNKTNSRTNGST